uniref:Uncharacterized protein n=1 Tax=Moorena producens (strain JHB) TaxID=1454205 RepID=A0A1D9G670_MOOP1
MPWCWADRITVTVATGDQFFKGSKKAVTGSITGNPYNNLQLRPAHCHPVNTARDGWGLVGLCPSNQPINRLDHIKLLSYKFNSSCNTVLLASPREAPRST